MSGVIQSIGGLLGGGSGGVGGSSGPLGSLTSLISKGIGSLGSALGMTGNPAGNFTPMSSLDPTQQATVNQAVLANPSLAGLAGQIDAVDPMTGGGTTDAQWAGVGQVGQTYLSYLAARRLAMLQQRTAYAPEHSTPATSGLPQLSLYPAASFALPQLGM